MSEVSPPKWSMKLLRFVIQKDYLEEIEGDMEEVFFDDVELLSLKEAKRLYTLGVLKLFRLSLVKNLKWIYKINFIAMTLSNIKIAFRTLLKSKTHSAINLIGLAMGLTIGGLIILYVSDEYSFDKFNEKGDRIFKVVTNNPDGGLMETNAWPVAYKLKTEYPEVEEMVYTRKAPQNFKVNYKDKKYEHTIHYAGDEFFKIFSFDFISGDPETALTAPYSIVITESMEQAYFEGAAIGQTLLIRDSLKFQVTGVIKDIPSQSHIQFDMLASFSTYEKLTDWFSYTEGWGNFNVRNYVLLKEGSDPLAVQSKAKNIYTENIGDWLKEMGMTFEVNLVPLKEVYLKPGLNNGFGPSGSQSQLKIVSLIAIFVLLLACINYINLSTARSLNRAKEVGIKKVNGSSRLALIGQFMIESYLLTFIAFVIALILMYLLLPFFNQLIEKDYSIVYFLDFNFLWKITLLGILIAFLAGFYPALVISGFKPLEAMKGKMSSNPKGIGLRKSLIIFQFFVSAGLILFTLLVLSQLNYMRDQDLGFDKEQIVVIDGINISGITAKTTFKTELSRLTQIESISFTNALPGRPGWQGQWAYPDEISEEQVDTEYMAIDEDYIETLGLELLAGSNFDPKKTIELEDGLIINEACMVAMKWTSPEDAIGKKIVSPSSRPAGTVIGVVKDYHGLGLQENIWPKAMDYASDEYGRYYAIKFTTGDTYNLIKGLENTWQEQFGTTPFDYFFLDDDFDLQYREEEKLARVLTLFTVVILIISGIGLFGLISFIALSKTKEVGIRKTLGASVGSIVFIFSKEFILLVVVGNLFSVPLVWYFGNRWLEDFAYHTALQWVIFPIAILATVLIAFLTVSLQTLKTAKMNPVKALRYE
jgi:putative ABC transport system permease protein